MNLIKKIIRDLFLLVFVLFFIFTLLETLKPKIILNYLDLNLFLIVVLILGVLAVLFNPRQSLKVSDLNILDYLTVSLFSFLIALVVFFLTKDLGLCSVLLAVVSFFIIYLFIVLIYKNKKI